MEYQQNTQTYVPPNGNSILELLDPAKEIENILYLFLGLEKKTQKINGKIHTQYIRVTKPMFTDEYIRGLLKDIQHFVNFTTQVSIYDQKRIKNHVGQYLLALKSSLATHGDDAYISSETWRNILDIYNTKTQIGDQTYNGWRKFGIIWDYNQPVNAEMLLYGVKIEAEEVEQSIEFKRVVRSLAPFLEGSLNKSYSNNMGSMGMLLSALGEMRTETQTIQNMKNKNKNVMFSQEGETWS